MKLHKIYYLTEELDKRLKAIVASFNASNKDVKWSESKVVVAALEEFLSKRNY